MNRRTTLVLAVLFAAIFVYVVCFESKGPTTSENGQRASRVLGRFEPEKVDALLISRGEERIDLRREPASAVPPGEADPTAASAPPHWRVQSPVADRADGAIIDALLNELESYRRDETVPVAGANADPVKLAPYGLQNPRMRLKITPKPGDRDAPPVVELRFGNDTPVQGRVFVQVVGREEVYAAPDTLRKQLEKPVGEFRDHRFTDLTPAEISRVAIKNAAGATLELSRDGDRWKLLKPQAARAGDEKMAELVGRLTDLTLTRFVAADDKTAVGALTEPRGTLTVASADRPPRTAELLVGKAVDAPPTPPTPPNAPSAAPPVAEVYASSPGRPGILVLPRTVEEFFNVKPEDVRDRQLARVNPDTVDRVLVQPAGAPPFTLSRVKNKPREWTLRAGDPGGPEHPANGAEVERLITRLPGQTVAGFAADTAGDPARYGLDHPALRVSFLAVASGPTAEGGAGEKAVATVSFGRAEGSNLYARLEEESFVVTVPRGTLEAVPTDPVAWQSPEIFTGSGDRVGALSVTLRGQPEVALERSSPDGSPASWKLVRGNGVTVDGVQASSVANTLARLRAVRWVGATRPEHGLDAPEATLTFTTIGSDPGDAGSKVLVGARAPEGGWFARVDGRPGTFLLNAPDHDTLVRPLVMTAPAAASATPPPGP